MRTSKLCKSVGLKSLKQLSVESEVPYQTLLGWRDSRPKVFRLMLVGAAMDRLIRDVSKMDRIINDTNN